MSLYKNEVRKILNLIADYRQGNVSDDELIFSIINLENQITNIEENEFRNFIQNIENEIEYSKFMISEKEYGKEFLKILCKLEKKLNDYIQLAE